MIHFECPAIKRLWEHSGVPAGEDDITQFLCQVVWECPRLLANGGACSIFGARDHAAVRDLHAYLKAGSPRLRVAPAGLIRSQNNDNEL